MQKAKPGYKLVQSFFGKETEIPEEWDYPKFSEVVKTNPITKVEEEKCPYIPMDAVDTSKSNVNYFEERILKDHSSLSKFQKNDVLFARITPSTENGKTAIIENCSKKGIVSSELTILRATKAVIPKYLYYFVKSHRIREFAISQMMGSTGRQRVPDTVFKKDLNFELPSLEEQQKIASILSNVDNLIDSYDKTIESTKKLKIGLIQTLLTKGIGHKKFKKVKWLYEKEIEIPEEWEVLPLSKICKIRDTNLVKSNLYIGLEHIDQNNNKLVGQSTTEEFTSNTNSFHNNDILYGKLRPLLNKVWLATKEGYCSTDILPLQTKDNIIPIILLLILTDYRFFWFAVSTSSGTKMPRTNWSNMKNFLVFLPSILEQQKIASILSSVDDKITKLELKKKSAESLKKGLMQKLLTGQIRVKV